MKVTRQPGRNPARSPQGASAAASKTGGLSPREHPLAGSETPPRAGSANHPRHFINKCGNHNVNPGQYVTTARKPSIVSSHGNTATVSSLMPILVMPEAT